MNESKIITALEIGNSKVQVFVGEIVDKSALRIIGSGNAHSYGIKKSRIIDSAKLTRSIEEAIRNAEKHIKIRKTALYLSIGGSQLQAMRSIGSSNIRSADNIVTQADIDRANDDAKSKTLDDSRILINLINCGYYLDGVYTTDPLGKPARRIDSEYWLVHGDEAETNSIISLLRNLNIEPQDLLLSSIASSLAVSTRNDRQEGVLVIDIGAGATDYAIYKNSKLNISGSISVGGEHITNDLAHGLRLFHINAEKLKKESKATISEDERKLSIWTRKDKQIGDKKVSLKAINSIIRSRLEEIFLIIRDDLGDCLDANVKKVILTGGASRMQGICEVAQGVFSRDCVKDKFNSNVKESFRQPEHATCIGILNHALENEIKQAQVEENQSLLSKIFKALS